MSQANRLLPLLALLLAAPPAIAAAPGDGARSAIPQPGAVHGILIAQSSSDDDEASEALAPGADPDSPVSYYNRGIERTTAGRFVAAIKDFDRAISRDRAYVDAHLGRGHAHFGLKQYENAIKDYSEAIKLSPRYATAFNSRGLAHLRMRDFEAAVKDFEEVIRMTDAPADDMAFAHFNRGNVYLAQKKIEPAISEFILAIENKPDFASAYYNLGTSKIRLRPPRYESAIRDLDEAISLDPDHSRAHRDRGFAKLSMRQYKDAIADLNEAIRLNPNLAAAYHYRGLAKEKVGDGSASADFSKAKSLGY